MTRGLHKSKSAMPAHRRALAGLAASLTLSFASAPPASAASLPASESVLLTLDSIEKSLTSTKYSHSPRINVKSGVYEWDCSIMVAWVLSKAAPRARHAFGLGQPLARDFYRVIAAKSTEKPQLGWLRVVGPSAIEVGDVFAWVKPPMFKEHKNTGHVGFVVGKPWRHPRYATVWVMRIADATQQLHEDDTRPPEGAGGFGEGTVAFEFDDRGIATAYGWYGQAQDLATYVPTAITFGRAYR